MSESERKADGAQIFPIPAKKAVQHAQESVREETVSQPVRRFRTILFQAYLILVTSAFAILALLANTHAYFPIDLTITRYLQTDHATWFTHFMEAVSWFGYPPQAVVIPILTILLIFLIGLRWEAVVTLLSLVIIQGANLAVKILVHRPRPSANLIDIIQKASGYSFPSGHVMFYVAFFGFLFFLVFILLRPMIARAILLVIFGALVVLIAPSRVFLGDHWASDVLGGYLLSSIGLLIIVRIYYWGKNRFFVDQPVASAKTDRPDSMEP